MKVGLLPRDETNQFRPQKSHLNHDPLLLSSITFFHQNAIIILFSFSIKLSSNQSVCCYFILLCIYVCFPNPIFSSSHFIHVIIFSNSFLFVSSYFSVFSILLLLFFVYFKCLLCGALVLLMVS